MDVERLRGSEPDVGTPDPQFWGADAWEGRRRFRTPSGRPGLLVLLRLAVVLLVLGTVGGLVLLWPRGTVHGSAFVNVHTDGATVTAVRRVRCRDRGADGCRRVSIELTSGPHAGTASSFTLIGETNVLVLAPGDHIRVYPNALPHGAALPAGEKLDPYSFSDFDRRAPMLWLAAGFAALLLVAARFRGLRALVGLGASLLVIVGFVIPAILHGGHPVDVAIVGALAVMLITMPLNYGLGAKMIAALLGTALSLLVAAGLADSFSGLAHLSGAGSDESLYLAATQATISLRGLLIAGMVIGALGVLLDLTVSQASTVLALRRANPRLGVSGLFHGALDVGQDHISATVTTLVFAYAGAALPVLLIFSIGHTSFTDAVNGEAVAEEVIAALVGSIGLILSMPLTTILAALLADRIDPDTILAEHAHAH